MWSVKCGPIVNRCTLRRSVTEKEGCHISATHLTFQRQVGYEFAILYTPCLFQFVPILLLRFLTIQKCRCGPTEPRKKLQVGNNSNYRLMMMYRTRIYSMRLNSYEPRLEVVSFRNKYIHSFSLRHALETSWKAALASAMKGFEFSGGRFVCSITVPLL